jgi:hypothetical protein
MELKGASPASRLYADALASIFGCCSLKELAVVMVVCRYWQTTVLRMRTIQGSVILSKYQLPLSFENMCASPLCRHVAHVVGTFSHRGNSLLHQSTGELRINTLARQFPQLQSLDATIYRCCSTPLQFPVCLHKLSVSLVASAHMPLDAIQAIVNTISGLGQLTELSLEFHTTPDLRPLIALTRLRKLYLDLILDTPHLHALGQMHQLYEIRVYRGIEWNELLHPGHLLRQLHTLDLNNGTQKNCDALATLPLLRNLRIRNGTCRNLASFAALVHLQQLSLSMGLGSIVYAPISVAPLQTCTQLTSLSLTGTAAPSHELLRQLTQLCELRLLDCREFHSFSIFAHAPPTLTNLQVFACRPLVPVTDLQHLLHLTALELLWLDHVLDQEPTPAQLALFQIPSPHFPALCHVTHVHCFRHR